MNGSLLIIERNYKLDQLKVLFISSPMQRGAQLFILELRCIGIQTFINKRLHDIVIIKFASIVKCSHSFVILNLWDTLIVRNQHLCQVQVLIYDSIMKWSLIMAIRRNRTHISFDENLKYLYQVIVEASLGIFGQLVHYILLVTIKLCDSLVTWILLEDSQQQFEFFLIHCILHCNSKIESTDKHQVCEALMPSSDRLLKLRNSIIPVDLEFIRQFHFNFFKLFRYVKRLFIFRFIIFSFFHLMIRLFDI